MTTKTDTTPVVFTPAQRAALADAALASLLTDPSDAALFAALPDAVTRKRVRTGLENARAAVAGTLSGFDLTTPDGLASAVAAQAEYVRLGAVLESVTAAPHRVNAAPVDAHQIRANYVATLRLAADLIDVDREGSFGTANVTQALALAGKRPAVRGANRFHTQDGFHAAFTGEPSGTFLATGVIGKRWDAAGGPVAREAGGRLSAREGSASLIGVVFTPATGGNAAGFTSTQADVPPYVG